MRNPHRVRLDFLEQGRSKLIWRYDLRRSADANSSPLGLVAVGDTIIGRLYCPALLLMLDHDLLSLEFGQRASQPSQVVDVRFGRHRCFQLGHQFRQRLCGLAHRIDDLLAGRNRLVDKPIQQLLEVPGKLADLHGAYEAATALDGVERPTDIL